MREMEISAPTREEAIQKALDELHVDKSDIRVEILDPGSRGIFGLGKRPVKIKVIAEGLAPLPVANPPREARGERGDRGGRGRGPREDRGNREGRGDRGNREARPPRGDQERPQRGRGDAPAQGAAPREEGKDKPREQRGPRNEGNRDRNRGGRDRNQNQNQAQGQTQGQGQGQGRNRQEPRKDQKRPERGPKPRPQDAVKPRNADDDSPSDELMDDMVMTGGEMVDNLNTDNMISGEAEAAAFTPISDEQGQEAAAALQSIIEKMGITATVEFQRGDTVTAKLCVQSEDGAILIGRKGRNLGAMQYLINRIVSQGDQAENTERLMVDVEGYVDRRRTSLEELARSLAERAKADQRNIRLKPLSPQERRIIHLTLQDDPDIRTYSMGDTLYRNVIISPKDARPERPQRSGSHRGGGDRRPRGGRNNNNRRQENKGDDDVAHLTD